MTDNDAFLDKRPCLCGVLEELEQEGREGERIEGCESMEGMREKGGKSESSPVVSREAGLVQRDS
jgi:hypothetical protein